MHRLLLIIFSALLAIAGASSGCLGFERIGTATQPAPLRDGSMQSGYNHPETGKGPLRVEIEHQEDAFRIHRDGKPYYIKGIAGREFLESAAAAGANSIRTWGPRDADVLLDRAQDLNMTVMLGIWLSQHASDYADPIYKKRKIQEVQSLVESHKNHPALLVWSLGNEINLEGADTRAAWQFVDELARMIKDQDVNHPVTTVISSKQTTLNKIAAFAPNLDAVGINAYGSVTCLRTMVDHSSYNGPYLITEWGVNGHWETAQTSWGRPIEPTGTQKAEYHLLRYAQDILANSDRCIGSYVFLWGQKQERTPTWFSMFLDNLPGTDTARVSFPAVDAMHFNWTGRWPVNRAPQVLTMMINDVPADRNIILSPGEPMISRVEAGDPENDPLSYVWELLEEPSVLGTGGSHEPRPKTLSSVRRDNLPVLSLYAPLAAGAYRLFVYVLDHNGHAGTANIPFQVRESRGQTVKTGRHPLGPG